MVQGCLSGHFVAQIFENLEGMRHRSFLKSGPQTAFHTNTHTYANPRPNKRKPLSHGFRSKLTLLKGQTVPELKLFT